MNLEQGFWKMSLAYDGIISIMYTWAVYQVYILRLRNGQE